MKYLLIFFLLLLSCASPAQERSVVFDSTLTQAAVDSLFEAAERAYFSVGSEAMPEADFIAFLDRVAAAPDIDEALRARASWLHGMVSRNTPGTPAADFEFTLPSGRVTTLYKELGRRSGNSILLLYDPDCNHCRRLIQLLDNEKQDLHVISVYPGEDTPLWEMSLPEMPQSWTVGHDNGSIEEDELYFYLSLPSLYIIAPDGTVVEKNPQWINL